MSVEIWSIIVSAGTFVVIAATAIAALIQLRHMRAGNQLTGLLDVLSRVESPMFNVYTDKAKQMLDQSLSSQQYRKAIESGDFPRENNAWLNLANSYEWVGSLVKHGLIPEGPFMDVYSSRLIRAWSIVEPVIAIARRRGDQSLWENFEFLVVRAHDWERTSPNGSYPRGLRRLNITDRWAQEDQASPDADRYESYVPPAAKSLD
jgi:Domain of unknown function (DUF4760)